MLGAVLAVGVALIGIIVGDEVWLVDYHPWRLCWLWGRSGYPW